MDYEKIIIKRPFNGNAQDFVKANGEIMFSSLTLDEYLKDNPDTEAITPEEYDKLHAEFFIRPFVEITADRWEEMLEVLPPMKWHTIAGRWNVFFLMEMTSGPFTAMYVKDYKTKLCYEGTKNAFQTDEQILADIKKEILGEV
jgi:hypothetical protein